MKPNYVQFGCGHSAGKDWLNFDSSATLRIERLPLVGALLGSLSGNARRFPGNVSFGNVCEGLPVESNTARGVYASHVIGTMTPAELDRALEETLRMLEPGGIFRVLTPDFRERARQYVKAADEGSDAAAGNFLTTSLLGRPKRPKGLIGRLRFALGHQFNLWMWDKLRLSAF